MSFCSVKDISYICNYYNLRFGTSIRSRSGEIFLHGKLYAYTINAPLGSGKFQSLLQRLIKALLDDPSI